MKKTTKVCFFSLLLETHKGEFYYNYLNNM